MGLASETWVYDGPMPMFCQDAYDSFGNILQNGGFNDSYEANNQMFGYPYHAEGNLLPGFIQPDGLFNQMTWDAESRITTVGGATYLYDAEGNRPAFQNPQKQGVGVTDTVYFGGRPIARRINGHWTNLNRTDLIYGPTGLLAEVPGTPTGAPVYRVTDHLGSTVGNLLADGTFVNPTDYTPFGQVFNGGTNDPYAFTGLEHDQESGLEHADARLYASNVGRWQSPDPYGGSMNLGNPRASTAIAMWGTIRWDTPTQGGWPRSESGH
jgi:RHS repeat-associated protein